MLSPFFAYGTLMPTNVAAIVRQRWTADAVRGRLFDLGPYPALVDLDAAGAGWVEGYVRVVEPLELEAFDRWEDVELGTYRRLETTTRAGVRAWVYEYARPLPPEARGPLSRWREPLPAQDLQHVSLGEGDRDVS